MASQNQGQATVPLGQVYQSISLWNNPAYAESGGLYMNPGDSLWFINGTDASATVIPIIEYAILNPIAGTSTGTILSG
jgi:hypothetical protein